MQLTAEQIVSMSVYRMHKYCDCVDCKRAREALKAYDDRFKCRSKDEVKENQN